MYSVYIELSFRSIDFDAIVNSGLASKQEVVSLLLKQLNLFMPGELVQTVQIKVIKKVSHKHLVESIIFFSF